MHGDGARALVRVGEFILDPGTGELRNDSGRQSLSAQPLNVLLALANRPGELVTRDELRQRLWPADTYVDFEHGLNAIVKRLRDALGDSADTPRYIETVPRRGYRLIAAVGPGHPEPQDHEAGRAVIAAAAAPPQPQSAAARWRRPLTLAASSLGAVALVAFASVNYRRGEHAANAGAPPTAVDARRLTFGPGLQTGVTWSPDGRRIAFAWDRHGNFDIFTQAVPGGEPTRIASTPAHDTEPAWSPDGQRLVFRADGVDGGLFTVSADGGPIRRITRTGEQPQWMPDGRDIVFSAAALRALYLVRADGGEPPREILRGQLSGGAWSSVAVHPDGRIGVLGIHPVSRFGFYVVDRAHRTLQPVDTRVALPLGWQTAFGRLHWNRAGTALFVEATVEGVAAIWRVPVDPETLAWQTPVRLTTGLVSADRAAVSPDGMRLAFTSAQSTTQAWVFPFDANARSPGQGRAITDEDATVGALSLARDGSALFYVEQRPGQRETRGMRTDVATGDTRVIVGKTCGGPLGSRDGQLVVYELERARHSSAGDREGGPDLEYALAIRDLEGNERLLAPWRRGAFMPSDWSPDDRVVLGTAMEIAYTGPAQLAEWPIGGSPAEAPSRILLSSPATQFWQGRYSPDHRWVSFVAVRLDADRPVELGIAPANSRGATSWTRLAADHAWPDKPRWSADGRTLYFLSSASGGFVNVWGVHIDPASGTQQGAPFQVTHFNSPRWHIERDMERCDLDMAKGRLVLPMRIVKGSIWVMTAAAS